LVILDLRFNVKGVIDMVTIFKPIFKDLPLMAVTETSHYDKEFQKSMGLLFLRTSSVRSRK
jgi:hypothetical protein